MSEELQINHEQQKGIDDLKKLGFENIDASRLLELSRLHGENPPLSFSDHVHPLAQEALLDFKRQAADPSIGVQSITVPSGFALCNWILVEALNTDNIGQPYYTTDIDTFTVFESKSQINDVTRDKLIAIRDNRPEGAPPFCTEFDPVDNSFDIVTFGLDRIFNQTASLEPHIAFSLILPRSNQVRLLEILYPQMPGSVFHNIREQFEAILIKAAKERAKFDPDLNERLNLYLQLDEGSLQNNFIQISRMKTSLLSPIKIKHILRSLSPKQTTTFGINEYKQTLRILDKVFGINVSYP